MIDQIDPFLCTHYIYATAGLNRNNEIQSLDPGLDLKENGGKGAYEKFTKLKEINPNLKTLISIGGWNEGSIKYSLMASNSTSRQLFVASVINFLKVHNFDGLDFNWVSCYHTNQFISFNCIFLQIFPANRGGKSEDKQNFVLLLRELKQALTAHDFLLSAAVSARKEIIDAGFDVAQVSR